MQVIYQKMWEWVRLGVGDRDGNHYSSRLGQESLLQTTTMFNCALPGRQVIKSKGSKI